MHALLMSLSLIVVAFAIALTLISRSRAQVATFGVTPAKLAPIGYRRDGRPIFPILGAADDDHEHPTIKRLEDQRAAEFRFIDKVTGEAEDAKRDLSDTERQNVVDAQERVKKIDEQLKPLREFYALESADQRTASRFSSTGGDTDEQRRERGLGTQVNEKPYEYRTAGEFLADTYRASSSAAQNNNVRLDQRMQDGARERLRSHGLSVEGGVLHRAAAPHNTTAEVPGLIPVSIVGPIMSDVDAARPFISSVGPRDLGAIPGLTFERPTITQHVQVAKQAAEKDEVANRQFKVDGIPFAKDTYGGWANVSRQSIDWTSPGVWDALMTDFVEQYGLETENAAADDFAASVAQTEELTTALGADPTTNELLLALYGAASKSYQGSGRLPDHIWASLDWWVQLGVLIDAAKAQNAGNGGGSSQLNTFAGNLLNVERTIVPSFPAGTLIIGPKSRVEVYEDRFGFLSAVQPKVFGVELAYGGYMASGTIKPAAFTKIVNAA